MRPVHAIMLVLPLCAYLFYRTAATEGRLRELEHELADLESAPDRVGQITTMAGSGHAAKPAGGGDEPAVAVLRTELESLREEIARLSQAGLGDDAHAEILEVVEREKQRVRERVVDFHQERWHEAREDMLEKMVKDAHFSEFQRQRVGLAMATEVDHLATISRTPRVLEDPDKLATDVQQLLDETNTEVLELLHPDQHAVWERHRAHERETFYGWLPR